ncbi:Hypothetical protein CINCED_3A016027, partial [Cinara cedri]
FLSLYRLNGIQTKQELRDKLEEMYSIQNNGDLYSKATHTVIKDIDGKYRLFYIMHKQIHRIVGAYNFIRQGLRRNVNGIYSLSGDFLWIKKIGIITKISVWKNN